MGSVPDSEESPKEGAYDPFSRPAIRRQELSRRPDLRYKPLNKKIDEIRLLILPNSIESSIRCSIVHVSLQDSPAYTALSYRWGGPNDSIQIAANGCKVSVTNNLGMALRELQRKGYNVVWVDALCINQMDEDEKSQQILRMEDIYSKATATVAWIGCNRRGYADQAFAHIALLASRTPKDNFDEEMKYMSQDFSRGAPSRGWAAFLRLLTLRYWKRTWIVQELAMSPSVKLLWGRQTLPLEVLVLALRNLEGLRNFGWPQDYEIVVGIMSILKRNPPSSKPTLTLLDALNFSCMSEATKLVDKIYGILGLCSDGASLIPLPDYRKPFETILRELTMMMLVAESRSEGTIDLICLKSRTLTSKSNLPSWVVDWRDFWDHKYGYLWSSPQKRGLTCGYKASLSSRQQVQFSDDGCTLFCNGFVLDIIDGLSSPPGTRQAAITWRFPKLSGGELSIRRNVYGSERELYEAIWRTLVMDRERTKTISDPEAFSRQFSRLWSKAVPVELVGRTNDFMSNMAAVENFPIYGRTVKQWSQWYESEIRPSGRSNSTLSSSQELSGLKEPSNLMHRFVRSVRLGRMYRRILTTQKGYVGLAHTRASAGDFVCILQGATMPVILRKSNSSYTVVGEAYVHGVMNGEAWETRDESLMQNFCIR